MSEIKHQIFEDPSYYTDEESEWTHWDLDQQEPVNNFVDNSRGVVDNSTIEVFSPFATSNS